MCLLVLISMIRYYELANRKVRQTYLEVIIMALSNLSVWAGSACGASDKPAADKPEEKPAACGSACGASGKPEEKPAACGTACGAGDK